MIRGILILLTYITSYYVMSQTKDIELQLDNSGVALDGTLTFSNEKQPLIIWISGSGNVDRNGNQLPMIKANYIKQFRDLITKKNFAFFSYDKRTANNKNTGKLKNIVFEDFVSDAKFVIKYFKTKYTFSKIIVIGHSQGSLVGMLASENVDKLISIAGPGSSIDKVILKQISRQNPAFSNVVKQHFEELHKTKTIQKPNLALLTIFNPKNYKFLYSWMRYSPSKEISKLSIPIAIIQGQKDAQVDTKDAMRLYNNNQKTQLFLIKDMNHVLKTIKEDTDNIKSYFSSEFPVSKDLVEYVTFFIHQKKILKRKIFKVQKND